MWSIFSKISTLKLVHSYCISVWPVLTFSQQSVIRSYLTLLDNVSSHSARYCRSCMYYLESIFVQPLFVLHCDTPPPLPLDYILSWNKPKSAPFLILYNFHLKIYICFDLLENHLKETLCSRKLNLLLESDHTVSRNDGIRQWLVMNTYTINLIVQSSLLC